MGKTDCEWIYPLLVLGTEAAVAERNQGQPTSVDLGLYTSVCWSFWIKYIRTTFLCHFGLLLCWHPLAGRKKLEEKERDGGINLLSTKRINSSAKKEGGKPNYRVGSSVFPFGLRGFPRHFCHRCVSCCICLSEGLSQFNFTVVPFWRR